MPSEAKIIQALDAKSLETIRLTESLALDPGDLDARAALTNHLMELGQIATEHGLVHLEASVQVVLDQLREESFGPASIHAARVLAARYQELARIPSRSGTHPVVTEARARGETPKPESLQGRRVVVADDDTEARWLYVSMLREAGARVVEATDGVRALELARLAAPDLILADILMPRLDGLALCAAVRREPRLDGVPIVLLSWRDDFLHRMRELRAGAEDYLRKELPARQVLDRVAAVLEPLRRFEEALSSGTEARGNLDELGASVFFRAVRRLRPNARIVLQDPWSLFEVELYGGRIVDVTCTAIDGTVTHGSATLMSLAGMSSGRFVVTEPISVAESRDVSLDEDFEAATRRLGELIAKLTDTPDCRVELDPAALTTYVRHSPARIQRMIARLAAGEPPRALWEPDEGSRAVVDALLVTLARQG
ncbi:MAG: response regulator, partial [Myxococcales bacterium]|nr:response regulator [Myxococcales bacterium]